MSENNTRVLLYNADGKIVNRILENISFDKIAANVFASNSDDENFTQYLYQYLVENSGTLKQSDNHQIVCNTEDPIFQQYCIGYGANEIINKALEEELEEGYQLFYQYLGVPMPSHPTAEDFAIAESQVEALRPQIEENLPLCLALNVLEIQSEIKNIMNGSNAKTLTSYQVNNVQEMFDNIAEFLKPEQQAAGYYGISILHRVLLGEQREYNPDQNNAEKACLQKVLDYSADYKRIDYCVNRLGYKAENKSRIRAAYRRALTATDSPYALYKINEALAECYINDYSSSIGYVKNPAEEEKLYRAELYYTAALNFAPEADKISVLKNIARLQKRQNKIAQWTETNTILAMEYLEGEERSYTLIKIANTNKDFVKDYLERALIETKRSELIPDDKKDQIYLKIDHHLRPIYKQTQDTKGIQRLDKLTAKITKQNPLLNPLTQYKLSKRKSSEK